MCTWDSDAQQQQQAAVADRERVSSYCCPICCVETPHSSTPSEESTEAWQPGHCPPKNTKHQCRQRQPSHDGAQQASPMLDFSRGSTSLKPASPPPPFSSAVSPAMPVTAAPAYSRTLRRLCRVRGNSGCGMQDQWLLVHVRLIACCCILQQRHRRSFTKQTNRNAVMLLCCEACWGL